jgi:hypothetical protein
MRRLGDRVELGNQPALTGPGARRDEGADHCVQAGSADVSCDGHARPHYHTAAPRRSASETNRPDCKKAQIHRSTTVFVTRMLVALAQSASGRTVNASADFAGHVFDAREVAVRRRVQLPGDAGDHDPGLEKQPTLEP